MKPFLFLFLVVLIFSCTKDKQQSSIIGRWHLTSEVAWLTYNSMPELNSKDTSTNTDYVADFRTDEKVYHSFTNSGIQYHDTANYRVQDDSLIITGIHDSVSSITQHIDVLTDHKLTLHSVIISTVSRENYWLNYEKD